MIVKPSRVPAIVTWLCLGLALAAPCLAAQPELLWKSKLAGRIYTSPLVCDLLPSPGLEIVVCDSERRQVVCISAQGKQLWSFGEGFTARLTSTPSAADLDGDGRLEIVAAGGGGNLVCLRGDGSLAWRTKTDGEVDWSAPVISDLNGDGSPEIILGSAGGLHCLSATGSDLWKARQFGGVSALPAVADLDGDGKKEIAVPVDRSLFCLGADGNVLWQCTGPTACDGVSIGDINADGKPELVATFDERIIYCLAGDGRRLWAYYGGYAGGGDGWLTPPALADMDGDGRLEIVVGDGSGALRCIDFQGRERWYYLFGHPIGDAPTIGDVDGSGTPQVFAGFDDDGTVLCLNSEPAIEWRFMADFRVTSSPSLADIDGDGRAEVLVSSNDNYLYCLRPAGVRRSGALPWPMRRCDAAQTGALVGR